MYNCKSLTNGVVNKNIFNNKFMNKSILVVIALQLLVFLTPIRKIFRIVSLNMYQTLVCLVIVIVVFILNEVTKKAFKKLFRD